MHRITRTLGRIFNGRWLGDTDASRISGTLFWSLIIAVAATATRWPPLLWGLSALTCGLLLGFLFGIPRVQQGSLTDPAEGDSNPSYRLRVNTNLEEISDWLTKIIVGLGLVQLGKIPSHFESIVSFLAQDRSDFGFAASILILFSTLGFLAGYLLTRVYLAGAFSRADQLSAEFDEKLDEARVRVKKSFPDQSKVEAMELDERSEQLIELSPRGAVIESWLGVTAELRSTLKRKGMEPAKSSSDLLRQVKEAEVLPMDQYEIVADLRDIRNIAIHSEEKRVSSAKAREYAELSRLVSEQLKGSADRMD